MNEEDLKKQEQINNENTIPPVAETVGEVAPAEQKPVVEQPKVEEEAMSTAPSAVEEQQPPEFDIPDDVKPIMDSGPKENPTSRNLLKYLGIAGVSFLVLILILGGYFLLRNMTVPEEVSQVQETTETTVSETPSQPVQESTTGLSTLENNFSQFGTMLDVLESQAQFENQVNPPSPEF